MRRRSRREQIDEEQRALNHFTHAVNLRLAAGKVPSFIRSRPSLIGQCVHDVVDATAVYLMICRERGSSQAYVKIGLARNIAKRMATIATGCPLTIQKAMYFCTPGYQRAYALEHEMHDAFYARRVRGEWFQVGEEAERQIVVNEMVTFAEDRLGENFNSFIYDPTLADHPRLPDVRTFLGAIWILVTDTLGNEAVAKELARLGASSDSQFRNVANALNETWGRY